MNPCIDWKEGQLRFRKADDPVRKTTVEEVEDEDAHIGTGFVPLGDAILEEVSPGARPEPQPDLLPDDATPKPTDDADPGGTPLYRFRANRSMRRAWVRAGVMEDVKEELWCAAGFTYSQQLTEQANKQKYEKIGEKKQTTPIKELCEGFPGAFLFPDVIS